MRWDFQSNQWERNKMLEDEAKDAHHHKGGKICRGCNQAIWLQPSLINHIAQQVKIDNLYKKACRPRLTQLFARVE